ncbi:MAG: twin-arginine translocase subunit TatC [Gammaproteobacteria bacterium]|nr:twin-arginine translocase subunit TatC [Gammaproteobacteria bacterium]
MTDPKEFPPPLEQPFVSHLIELRDRLLKCVVAVAIIFLALFSFSNDIYVFLAEPLIKSLPQGSSMIATGVISPFLTPFKLTLVVSIFVAIPYLLYQAWAFVAPGLYKNERRLAFPLIVSSTILFYVGMAFAYYVVFPLVFGFMAMTTPEGVVQAPDISMFLDFSIKMFFAFGFAFEVPIATILVIWAGLTTVESLTEKRPYIIVAAFVIGMLLTPPDVISQTLLAVPMWLLFEAGLYFSKLYAPQRAEEDTESEAAPSAADTNTKATNVKDTAAEDNGAPAGYGDSGEYRAMTEAEMDAELDRIEREESEYGQDSGPHPVYEPLPDEEPETTSEENNEQPHAKSDK